MASKSITDIKEAETKALQSIETAKKDAEKIVENYIKATRNPNLKLGKIEDSGNAFRAQIVTRENSLVEEVLIDKDSGYMRPAY